MKVQYVRGDEMPPALKCQTCGGHLTWDPRGGFQCRNCGQSYEVRCELVKSPRTGASGYGGSCETEEERKARIAELEAEREALSEELSRCWGPFHKKRRSEIRMRLAILQRQIAARRK